MNLCLFMGRLTADPELRYTPSGQALVDFTIAINDGKNSDGSDRVEFVRCTAWADTAEFVAKWFKKGKPISVQSSLKTDKWEDKTSGEARSSVKFTVYKVTFVPGNSNGSGKEEADNSTPNLEPSKKKPGRKPKAPVDPTPSETPDGVDDDDNEVPF